MPQTPFKTSAKQKRDRDRDSQPRPRPRLNSQPQGATKRTRFSLLRISVQDLVAGRNAYKGTLGLGGGGQNLIPSLPAGVSGTSCCFFRKQTGKGILRVVERVVLGKRCFRPLPKTGGLDENRRNSDPLKQGLCSSDHGNRRR